MSGFLQSIIVRVDASLTNNEHQVPTGLYRSGPKYLPQSTPDLVPNHGITNPPSSYQAKVGFCSIIRQGFEHKKTVGPSFAFLANLGKPATAP